MRIISVQTWHLLGITLGTPFTPTRRVLLMISSWNSLNPALGTDQTLAIWSVSRPRGS
jgi:hypothetical protein